jgi:hypothetical protein
MPYTFGDTDVARRRLDLLAEVFEPSTRSLLSRVGTAGVATVADLGCGPGHTTALLEQSFPDAVVTGFDASEGYVSLAAVSHRVVHHDVTAGALPGAPYDLVFARFLVTHLADPEAAVALWSSALAPGGALVLEETESLASALAPLSRYYELVEAMQRSHGQRLGIGSDLPALARSADLSPSYDMAARLDLPVASMARLHALNLATWKHDAYIVGNGLSAEANALETALHLVTDGPPVHAVLRQVIAVR